MPSRKRVSSPADKELVILLKDVVASIASVAAVGLVDLLYGKKNVNEFLIAKKLNLNINQTRNILYKLVDEGLVSFIRKKDSKNGGWYTYYWTLDSSKSIANLRNTLLKDMQHLEQKLESANISGFITALIATLRWTKKTHCLIILPALNAARF